MISDINIINDLLTRIIEHSKTKCDEYSEKYATNKKVTDELNMTIKYINRCDKEYLARVRRWLPRKNFSFFWSILKNNSIVFKDDEPYDKSEIKRCNNFYDKVYRDIVNLLHDYKDIIIG